MKKILGLLLAVGLLLSSAGAVYADNVSQIIGDGNTVVLFREQVKTVLSRRQVLRGNNLQKCLF